MRIVMVTPWFPHSDAQGAGVFVMRDALAVASVHDVQVIHLDSAPGAAARAGSEELGGLSVLRIPFNRSNPRHWARAFMTVRAIAGSADAVHTHSLTGLAPFALARPGGRVRWVHTEHWSGVTSPETLSAPLKILRRLLMPLLARPDAVVVACERLAQTIRKVRRGPIANIPCVVVPPQAVVPAPDEKGMLRIIGVGGLIPRKGPVCALEAVAELEKRGVSAHLTWVGDGPQRDELTARARRLRLTDSLTLTGNLPEHLVRKQLDAADVFLLPTLGDNFCIVVAEALSHGRPVVSGADTGAVDYSHPEVSRFVDDDKNPRAYADAIQDVMLSSRPLGADGIAATVHGKFTPERVADLLAQAYVAS